MAVSVIIGRIRSALDAGELKVVPDSFNFKPIDCMSDLLRPWEEMFPGVERSGEDDTRSIFSWGGLRQPKFAPRVRRSRRPLSAPLPIKASPKSISPAMFDSVQGIWEYYQARDLADSALPQLPFDTDGLQKFVQPLLDAVMNYYPLFIPLEMLMDECGPAELQGIHLMLPHWSYEEEGVDVVEAFLSGADGVHSLLSHHLDDSMELPDKDRSLIKKVGLEKLVGTYALYPGAKSYDLDRLFNWYEVYFDSVKRRFPGQMETDWPIISGNAGFDNDVTITCAADIDFCIAYAYAYDSMMVAMPAAYDFASNEGGEMETFVHEICNVWRKQNGKRLVKWTSPKSQTLANVFKKGEP